LSTADAGTVLRLDLEFDGAGFLGWQRQAEGRTVQATVEAALAKVLRAEHRVVGAGRTDAGVHARQMVVSCPTDPGVDPFRLARSLDAVLPPDVGVRAVTLEAPGFHARRDAAWKWYRYTLLLSRGRRPLLSGRVWHHRGPIGAPGTGMALLRAGAAVLVGRHDFASFAASGSPRKTTDRTLYGVTWTDDAETECLFLDVVGNGFLYKMVRTLVGTMVREARAGGPPEAVKARMRAVLGAGDRRAAGPSAPARGLCLMAVGMVGEEPACRLPPNLARAVESGLRSSPGGRS